MVDRRPTAIQTKIKELELKADCISERLDTLYERLVPILGKGEPGDRLKEAASLGTCDMEEHLNIVFSTLSKVQANIENMLEKLQL